MTFGSLVADLREYRRVAGHLPDAIFVRHSGQWRQVLETSGLSGLLLQRDPARVAHWGERQVGEFDGIPVLLAKPEQMALVMV